MFLRRIDIDEFRNLKGINISRGKTMMSPKLETCTMDTGTPVMR
jgi:hypothetical protein